MGPQGDAKDHLLRRNQQIRPDPRLPHLRQLHRVHIAPLAPALDRALPPAPLLAVGAWVQIGSESSGSVSRSSWSSSAPAASCRW